MQPLREILLIDDSESDNFVHSRVIKKAQVTAKVTIKYSGEEGLTYLKTLIDEDYPRPDLIFLDINMPGMDGFEFLEHYEDLEDVQKAGVVIAMLTTSTSPVDKKKAEKYDLLQHFDNKPLTQENLLKILKEQFPGRFDD
ncbi:CheY-like chemotaxis protein [Dokdonia sp. Hel_I_63]|jgi:CheY-like chemotaxis protein|uniref:response regulator n=1 Tax=unclassified Dokdonia TaxID=2615033 RepID=UPI00020A628F|nr:MULTISPECIES: response regulator [unclassified Dokdonia]AEE18873.1 response regulator receiver [Dokdonia sp. 4H-3-7-5]TVZ21900.1 CheY-like chemotaxis protein [Dokdonia sp. Hel_I_63]